MESDDSPETSPASLRGGIMWWRFLRRRSNLYAKLFSQIKHSVFNRIQKDFHIYQILHAGTIHCIHQNKTSQQGRNENSITSTECQNKTGLLPHLLPT